MTMEEDTITELAHPASTSRLILYQLPSSVDELVLFLLERIICTTIQELYFDKLISWLNKIKKIVHDLFKT